MKRIINVFAIMVFIPLVYSCSSSTDFPVNNNNNTNSGNTWTNNKPIGTSVGQQAPEISMNDVNGASFKLSSKRGNIVLVDFWASWCGPCRTSATTLKNLKSTFAGKAFDVVSVSFDFTQDDCKNYITSNGMVWNHVYGGYDMSTGLGPLAQTYNISGIPQFVLLDKYGTIIYRASNDSGLETQITNALK